MGTEEKDMKPIPSSIVDLNIVHTTQKEAEALDNLKEYFYEKRKEESPNTEFSSRLNRVKSRRLEEKLGIKESQE